MSFLISTAPQNLLSLPARVLLFHSQSAVASSVAYDAVVREGVCLMPDTSLSSIAIITPRTRSEPGTQRDKSDRKMRYGFKSRQMRIKHSGRLFEPSNLRTGQLPSIHLCPPPRLRWRCHYKISARTGLHLLQRPFPHHEPLEQRGL